MAIAFAICICCLPPHVRSPSVEPRTKEPAAGRSAPRHSRPLASGCTPERGRDANIPAAARASPAPQQLRVFFAKYTIAHPSLPRVLVLDSGSGNAPSWGPRSSNSIQFAARRRGRGDGPSSVSICTYCCRTQVPRYHATTATAQGSREASATWQLCTPQICVNARRTSTKVPSPRQPFVRQPRSTRATCAPAPVDVGVGICACHQGHSLHLHRLCSCADLVARSCPCSNSRMYVRQHGLQRLLARAINYSISRAQGTQERVQHPFVFEQTRYRIVPRPNRVLLGRIHSSHTKSNSNHYARLRRTGTIALANA